MGENIMLIHEVEIKNLQDLLNLVKNNSISVELLNGLYYELFWLEYA
jgi:hypothetical protein